MSDLNLRTHCCPDYPAEQTEAQLEVSRRSFLAMGGVLMGGLSYAAFQGALQAADDAAPVAMPTPRKPLIVKPILCHNISSRREAASWRQWGGIQSVEDANEEVVRIKGELAAVAGRADYPIEFLDVGVCTNVSQLKDHPDIEKCDTILLYPAGHNINGIQNFGKDVVIFTRWDSGPVYRHIITISARFLRQHTDEQAIPTIRNSDVVIDDPKELDWRFRALCGLKNSVGSKIITIGGAGGWAQPYGNVPEIAKNYWKYEYHDISYPDMRKLIEDAKADDKACARAKKRAEAYLKIPGTKLETTEQFFVDCFLLDDLFRVLMKEVGTNMITVNSCMGAIMPASKTTACLTLSTLCDDGYQAYCESDFVVIPSAVLTSQICGKPVFFGNPGFPFNGTSTICHCTAPRKMDGKKFDPVRIVTHYESDYGAAPWVDFQRGITTTHVVPSFKSNRWVGMKGTVVNVPFKPSSCRSQITVKRECTDELLADNLVGFHWITAYGDYRKEIGYALRRVGIQWDNLDEFPVGRG